MRKAERILKKCSEYYALVSRAQRFRVPVPSAGAGAAGRLGLERALLEQPKPFTGFVDHFGNPIAPIEPVKPSPVAVEPAKPVLYDAQNRPILVETTKPAPISAEPTPAVGEPAPTLRQLNFLEGKTLSDEIPNRELNPAERAKYDKLMKERENLPTANRQPASPATAEPVESQIQSKLPEYTYEVQTLPAGKTVNPKSIKVENNRVKIYVDENGKILKEYLPKEIKDLLISEDTRSVMADKLKVETDVGIKSSAKVDFSLARNLSEKYKAIKGLAKAYNSEIYGYSAVALCAVIILGVLYSLFTGDSPKSKNAAVGNKLKESVDEGLSSLSSTGIIKSNELANQVSNISELVKKHQQLSKNPENQQILKNMSSVLDDIHLNLSLKSFIIDDKASQAQFAQQLATLNSSIEKVFQQKYLSRFSGFLKAKNENNDAAKVEACEKNLANYRQALVNSNRAAQSSGSADSATM